MQSVSNELSHKLLCLSAFKIKNASIIKYTYIVLTLVLKPGVL